MLLLGMPGVAKSSVLAQLKQRTSLHVEIMSVGERGEGAFGVVPVPVENGGGRTVLTYPAPEWTRALRVDEDGTEAGFILVDEINTAAPALQPALMGAVLDKRFGGHTCGKRVRIIGAMNPVGHAAGGWDLPAPTANRFGHLDWTCPTADEWGNWLLGGNESLQPIDVDVEEKRVLDSWPAAWAKASGLVAAFVRRRPELLHKMPPDGDPAQSRAWPSPRTWEFATRALASATVHGLTEIEADEFIAAFVGTDAAAEFVAWVQDQDLPEPADLLDGNSTWKHDPTRLDRTSAVLGACVALVTPKNSVKREARTKAAWALLATVDAKDMIVPAATTLAQAGLGTSWARKAKCKAALDTMSRMSAVMEAAKDKTI